MKKILSILLLCAMLLTVCACGNQQAEEPQQPQQSEQIQQPEAESQPSPGDLTKPAPPYATGTGDVETPAAPEAPSQEVVTAPDSTSGNPLVQINPAQPETPAESETPAEPDAPAEPETPAEDESSMEEPAMPGEDLMLMVEDIYAICGPQFMHMTMPLDLSDSETLAYFTGISDPSLLTAAVVNESMMGSQAYSLVLCRVADAANAEDVANTILNGVNPAKWICVQADDLDAGIKGDLVLFVMIDSQMGLPAADIIAAFSQVAGGLDKELSK